MQKYFVTWQPEECDSGMFFVTAISGPAGMTPEAIVEQCFVAEDVEPQDYTLCSIIRADETAEVVF